MPDSKGSLICKCFKYALLAALTFLMPTQSQNIAGCTPPFPKIIGGKLNHTFIETLDINQNLLVVGGWTYENLAVGPISGRYQEIFPLLVMINTTDGRILWGKQF